VIEMVEWIVILISIIGLIGSVIGFFRSQAASEARIKAKISNVEKNVEEIKQVIGNGQYHGLRQELEDMKIVCAGSMASVKEQIGSQQHQINELKKSGG
jgi:hypothetical protein